MGMLNELLDTKDEQIEELIAIAEEILEDVQNRALVETAVRLIEQGAKVLEPLMGLLGRFLVWTRTKQVEDYIRRYQQIKQAEPLMPDSIIEACLVDQDRALASVGRKLEEAVSKGLQDLRVERVRKNARLGLILDRLERADQK
jgi:hypothetical protein